MWLANLIVSYRNYLAMGQLYAPCWGGDTWMTVHMPDSYHSQKLYLSIRSDQINLLLLGILNKNWIERPKKKKKGN